MNRRFQLLFTFLTILFISLVLRAFSRESARGSAQTSPGASLSASVFVEVVRLKGPDNTMLMLEADGTLARLEGSHLVVRRHGTQTLEQALTESLIEQAAGLGASSPSSAPVEGDLYLVVFDGKPPIAAVDAVAPPDLRRLVEKMLDVADEIPTAANTSYFLRYEPVVDARAERLEAAGVSALRMAAADSEVRPALAAAHTRPFHLQILRPGLFEVLLDYLGGREGFVMDGSGSWYQVTLWSPP